MSIDREKNNGEKSLVSNKCGGTKVLACNENIELDDLVTG